MAAEHVERIGTRIRARREELGLSRDEVARQMPGNTNGNAIYRWEKGRHEPRSDTLEALAAVLDVEVAYFYTDPADKSAGTPDLLGQFSDDAPQWAKDLDEKLDIIIGLLDALGAEVPDEAAPPSATRAA